MCHAMRTVQLPYVGSLVNTQGQPTLQLHASKYVPVKLHLLGIGFGAEEPVLGIKAEAKIVYLFYIIR